MANDFFNSFECLQQKGEGQSITFNEDIQFLKSVGLLARSLKMAKVGQIMRKCGESLFPVLIQGETGTGKELVARGIHNCSKRKKAPFIPINCSAFKDDINLLEGQLFGHEKGSFTGADRLKLGIFEEAHGGTVFLDEVHHLNLGGQAKLLRFLQEGKIRRVGGVKEIPIDVRIISASKPNLFEKTGTSPFLEDFFYRISSLEIELPPLRERKEDILLLMKEFQRNIFRREGFKRNLTPNALKILLEYDWPGNVRELISIIERLAIMGSRAIVDLEELREFVPHLMEKKVVPVKTIRPISKIETLEDLESFYEHQIKIIILKSLLKTNHNVSKTAVILGEKRSTLNSKMKKFGLFHLENERRKELLQELTENALPCL